MTKNNINSEGNIASHQFIILSFYDGFAFKMFLQLLFPLIFLVLKHQVISTPIGSDSEVEDMKIIYNFASENDFASEDVDNWWESSDTVREPGKSKAAFVLQKSKLFQRAVFFAMLNPQPNGAGFAGVKTNVTEEFGLLSENSEGFYFICRAQGNLKHWKIVLTNEEFGTGSPKYTYEAKFEVNIDSEDFETIKIPFADFKAFYRGAVVFDAPPLDLQKIGLFGFQTFGGVYDEFKQQGVGSLEIDIVAFY